MPLPGATGVFSAMEKQSLFRLVAQNNTMFTDVISKIGLLERSDAAWHFAALVPASRAFASGKPGSWAAVAGKVVGMRDSSLVANPEEVARKHLVAQTVAPAGTRGKSPRSVRGG